MGRTQHHAPLDLREYLALLREEGELLEIDAEVDPVLEAAEVHRRVIAAGGPALLFKRPKGARFPLVTNLYGTAKRVELAFGRRPQHLIEEVARFAREAMPPTPGRLWSFRGLGAAALKVGLTRTRKAPVARHVVRPPRLSELPALHTWPRDGGRFLTLPLVYTEDPELGIGNLGMYRVQLFDDTSTGMHIQIHRGGGNHLAKAEALGRPLPVNVFLGGPPALTLGAISPLPENVPELVFTSLLLGRRLRMGKNPAGPLPLVADAEFTLVGELPNGERRPDGPFGDHYGSYSEVHDFPWLRVDALLHREGAIYPATVVGKPRQEDFFIGDHLQELLSPLFPLVMPSVRALWSYGETGYHSLSAAVVTERYERESMVSAFRILGEGQLSLTKFLLLTDSDVDLRDFAATLTHVLERCDPRTDLFVFANLSMDTLDYAGPRLNRGSKGVLLGVGEKRRELPREFRGETPPEVRAAIPFCPGCLVVEGPSYEAAPDAWRDIASHLAFRDWPLLVLTDDARRATRSSFNFLWTTFTRFDPAADLHASRVEALANHVVHHPPLILDARMKPGYPEELFADDATRKLVDARWKEYFPAGGVAMGDSDRAHLD